MRGDGAGTPEERAPCTVQANKKAHEESDNKTEYELHIFPFDLELMYLLTEQ